MSALSILETGTPAKARSLTLTMSLERGVKQVERMNGIYFEPLNIVEIHFLCKDPCKLYRKESDEPVT